MFTGIIESKCDVVSHDIGEEITMFHIQKPEDWKLKIGQSIAVNGACLTVTKFGDTVFTVELIEETLQKTSFGQKIPTIVNVERAMLTTDRFEGHIVQGHIDTTEMLKKIEKGNETAFLTVSLDTTFKNLVVDKGSITIDGVSLTVVEVRDGYFTVSLIPHTLSVTTLGLLQEGDKVNLEFDIVGKYITKINS